MRNMQGFFKRIGINKTYRDLAGDLRLNNKTLYNWRKDKDRQRILELIEKGYLYEMLENNIKEYNNKIKAR